MELGNSLGKSVCDSVSASASTSVWVVVNDSVWGSVLRSLNKANGNR